MEIEICLKGMTNKNCGGSKLTPIDKYSHSVVALECIFFILEGRYIVICMTRLPLCIEVKIIEFGRTPDFSTLHSGKRFMQHTKLWSITPKSNIKRRNTSSFMTPFSFYQTLPLKF